MNTETQKPNFELIMASSGLDADRQVEIRDAFAPFAVRVSEWAEKVALVDDPKVARETRLAMRRERIGLDKKHVEFKSRVLSWTKAVDGSRKVISDAYDEMEAQMAEIEEAEVRRLAAEKAARKAERDAALRQYGVDVTWIQTGDMSDAQFLTMLDQAKIAHEAKIAAEKRAEEERIAREKKEAEARAEAARKAAEERERLRVENERLEAERKAQEEALRIERERVAKERTEAEAKAKAERDAIEAKAAEEKKKADALLAAEREKARKQREAMEAEAEKLREERARAEAEVQAKVEAEKKRKEAEEQAATLAAQAPDAEKLEALADALETTALPGMATEVGQKYLARARRGISVIVENLRGDAQKLVANTPKLSESPDV